MNNQRRYTFVLKRPRQRETGFDTAFFEVILGLEMERVGYRGSMEPYSVSRDPLLRVAVEVDGDNTGKHSLAKAMDNLGYAAVKE